MVVIEEKAFRLGMVLKVARGRFIGFMDADYKTDIKAFDEVMMQLENRAEVVIGDHSHKPLRSLQDVQF